MRVLVAFFDDGHDGTWLDCILHSPCLKVLDYAGCDDPHGHRFAPAFSLHSTATSVEALPHHGDQ